MDFFPKYFIGCEAHGTNGGRLGGGASEAPGEALAKLGDLSRRTFLFLYSTNTFELMAQP